MQAGFPIQPEPFYSRSRFGAGAVLGPEPFYGRSRFGTESSFKGQTGEEGQVTLPIIGFVDHWLWTAADADSRPLSNPR